MIAMLQKPTKHFGKIFLFCAIWFFIPSGAYSQSCGFTYSKTLSIDHTKVSGSGVLTDFPMLISITDNNLRSVANGGHVQNTNGYDIYFLGSAGERLAHELVSYTATTGNLIVWVKVPLLYGSFNTDLQMVYGNAAISTDQSTAATWESNYEAVLHLQEVGNGTDNEFRDATANAHHGTGGGLAGAGSAAGTPSRVAGKFGFAQNFDDGGTADLIRLNTLNDATWTAVTVEAWVRSDDNGDDRIFGKSWGTGTGDQTWLLRKTGGTAGCRMRTNSNTETGFDPATLPNGVWQHLLVTWDASDNQLRVYRNGVEEGNTILNGATLYTTPGADQPTIGNTTTLDRGFDGLIQEARVSKVARSADWIATQYENQNDPSMFYSVSAESGGTYIPSIPTCGHSYQKVITINSAQVSGSGSHTDFPVLISRTDADLRTVANGGGVQHPNGYDIVFTDNNYVPLDYDIESYNATTGAIQVWVKIPSLPTGTNTIINMFYGDSDIFANPSTPCTWSGNFEGVWHMNGNTNDATDNVHNGIDNGTVNIAGQISNARDFDGTDFIELTNFPNLTTDFTMSAWIRTTNNAAGGQRVFCDDVTNTGGYALSLGDGGTGRPRFYSRSMSNVIVDGSNSINNNTWYHIVAVADRTNQDRLIYVNGVLIGSYFTDTGTWGTDAGNSSIGGETNSGESGNRFRGRLDEVRVATAARSAGWIITEYNNQLNPATFYSVGAEIALNATSTGTGDWSTGGIWSTGNPPPARSIVTIMHDVDLSDRDLTICKLTIANTNNVASLEIRNGRSLTVEQDVELISNDATSSRDVTLRTMNNNSKLVTYGNMILDHDDGDDIRIDVESAGDSIVVYGDLIMQHDGGDDMEILVDNGTAVMVVHGDVIVSMNSGVDDLFEIDLNAGQFITNGTFAGSRSGTFTLFHIDLDGGDFTADSMSLISSGGTTTDVIYIMVDGTSQFTVNNGMYLEMGGGDDHRFDVNQNSGTSANLTIGGNLNIVKSGADDLWFRVGEDNSVMRVMGDLNITSTGGEEIQFQIDNDATFDVDGDMTVDYSEGELFHIYLQGAGSNPTFNVDGNLNINANGGEDFISIELYGGNFNVGGDFTLDKADNTGNLWVNLDDMTMTVNGAMNALHNGDDQFFIDLDGTAVLNAGSFYGVLNGVSANEELLIHLDGNSIMNVTNDMELELNTGNDVEFHLGNNVALSSSQLNVGGKLLFDHNGAAGGDDIQLTINESTSVTITGNFTMETNGSSAANNFFTRINDDGLLSVRSNLIMNNSTGPGYLEIEMNGNSKLELGGNIVRNAPPNNFGLIQSNSVNTTIEYNGSTAQIFADEDGAGSDGIEYEQVIINNSFGTEPQLTMEAPVTITGSITFTDGVLQSTLANLLTIGDNATANAGSVNSYVSGPLRKQGNDPFVFPIGKDGIWARLGISDLQNGPTVTDQFTAEYFVARHPESFFDSNSYAGNPGGLKNVSIVEYWDFNRDAGTAQPKVTLYWESGANSYIDDMVDLTIGHLTGAATWTNEGGTTSGTVAAGSVTSVNNISSFSVFTFGSTSSSSNPLPVELLNFEAKANVNLVDLLWTTLSEINNDYFTVERSENGIEFEEVLNQKGAGNSNSRNQYFAQDDNPFKGLSYYRLKQTDFNGEYSYSDVVAVTLGKSPDLFVYPNPWTLNSPLHLIMPQGNIKWIELYTVNGKQININYIQENTKVVILPLPRLKSGLYLLKVVMDDQVITERIVVKNDVK